jgi:hypothetical protein
MPGASDACTHAPCLLPPQSSLTSYERPRSRVYSMKKDCVIPSLYPLLPSFRVGFNKEGPSLAEPFPLSSDQAYHIGPNLS